MCTSLSDSDFQMFFFFIFFIFKCFKALETYLKARTKWETRVAIKEVKIIRKFC